MSKKEKQELSLKDHLWQDREELARLAERVSSWEAKMDQLFKDADCFRPELLEKWGLAEIKNADLDAIIAERDAAVEKRDEAVEERDDIREQLSWFTEIANQYGCSLVELREHIGSERQVAYFRNNHS